MVLQRVSRRINWLQTLRHWLLRVKPLHKASRSKKQKSKRALKTEVISPAIRPARKGIEKEAVISLAKSRFL